MASEGKGRALVVGEEVGVMPGGYTEESLVRGLVDGAHASTPLQPRGQVDAHEVRESHGFVARSVSIRARMANTKHLFSAGSNV